jgi:hypothetical protein
MAEQNPSRNFLYRFGDFITAIIGAVWNAIITIFKGLWQVVVKGLDFVAQLLGIIAKFIRSIFLGVAAIIVSIGLLIFAMGGAFYLIGKAVGLDNSKNLETTRELILNVPAQWIGENMDKATPTENVSVLIPREEPVNIPVVSEKTATNTEVVLACEQNSDCPLPMEYAIRSNCPYEARCVEEKCAVVCPEGFTDTDSE